MEQLIITIEDNSMTASLRKAIMLLKGVTDIKRYVPKTLAQRKTMKAIREYQQGDVVECTDFDDYLSKVK